MSIAPLTRAQKAIMALVVALVVGFLAAGVVVSLDFIDARKQTDQIVVDQSRKNQLHIDCLVALLIRRDPPICKDVKQQLIDEGILPPFPLPPPTTGAPAE